jgi:hypothetical protein
MLDGSLCKAFRLNTACIWYQTRVDEADDDLPERTLTRREAQFKHLVRFSLLSYGPIAPTAIVLYASGTNLRDTCPRRKEDESA